MNLKTLSTTLFFLLLGLASAFSIETHNSYAQQEPVSAIIELLENGERYSIEITSIGCFNGTRQTVTISRNENVYTANFQDEIKVLSEEDISIIINFESRLHSLEIGGCTTVDTYVLRYAGNEFRTSDGTCSWNGGSKLLKIFA